MVFKEATDCCSGTAVIYGAPDIKKISQYLNGNAIDCSESVLPRDCIFTISQPCCTTKRLRFDITSGIAMCTTIVATITGSTNFTLADICKAQAFTNKNINGATNTITGAVVLACNTQELWVGAEAMYGCGVSCFCNPAIFVQRVTTCDVIITAQGFDTTTAEKVEFQWTPPANWDASTIRWRARWTNASGLACETIDFDLQGRSIADDDAIGGAQGSATNVTDTFTAQNDENVTAFSAATTIGNCPVAGDRIVFRLTRDVTADNLTGDAEILGITIEYGIDSVSTT